MAKRSKQEFVFRKNDTIGTAEADTDLEYLHECFVDSGDLAVLADCSKPNRIIVGRTGSGKTALIKRLAATCQNVIEIQPESLSLQYLCNTTIISVLENLGVKMDLFYRLLWRHIFIVELIKARYGITSESKKDTFLTRLSSMKSKDKNRDQAIKYLQEWGSTFWEQTEYRIKELTSKLEAEVEASLGSKLFGMLGNLRASQSIGREEVAEIINRSQTVVNAIQIGKMSEVMSLLEDEMLASSGTQYYIVIDRLDENWIEDSTRYRLIRALIETVKEFLKVQHAKIIIALRRDLLEHVFRVTRDAGFQEEKYESLYLQLTWSDEQLLEVLNLRVQKLVRHRYTKSDVDWRKLLPQMIHSSPIDRFLLDRTLYRPRDIILFFNECIGQATNTPRVGREGVLRAEGQYSAHRFRALATEWNTEYNSLLTVAKVLRRMPPSFEVRDLKQGALEDVCLELQAQSGLTDSLLSQQLSALYENKISLDELRLHISWIFYHVGLIGLKVEAQRSLSWSFRNLTSIQKSEIAPSTMIAICPAFFRVLAVNPRSA